MQFQTDKETAERIKALADNIIKMLTDKKSPFISVPLRTLSNVHYDESKGLLFLGDKEMKRVFTNVAHSKKFMQTLIIAEKVLELVQSGKTASIRELYYELKHSVGETKENTFEGQEESDPLIEDLEVILDSLREQLHLKADPKGRIFGNLIIEDSGDTIDCSKMGKSGLAISSIVDDYKFLKCDADYILVVETSAMLDRLVEEKFHEKNRAIMIGTAGQAARGARRLIHLLNKTYKLPVYVFTDGDPWGFYIYSVIKTGSMNLAYESKRLATPDAKFLGMTVSDVDSFGLHKVTEKLKDEDISRAKQLLSYKWFQRKEWQDEINLMIKKNVRIEQQALASRSLDFVSKVYLPDKIARKNWLP